MIIFCFTILGDESSAFWTMVGVILLAISFYFVRKQIVIQNRANMMSFISSSEDKWRNKEFSEIRKKVCSSSENAIDKEQENLLSFFEDLGILYKRNVIDIELIWEKFSYYIEHYWLILKPNINTFRSDSNDNTWYENFENLHSDIFKYSIKKTKNRGYRISEKDIEKFKKSETE